jgi:hypothetical protein
VKIVSIWYWKLRSIDSKCYVFEQGMEFLARLFLLYMSEEDAFWLLVVLLKGVLHAPMEGLYLVRSFKRLDKQKNCSPTLFVHVKTK